MKKCKDCEGTLEKIAQTSEMLLPEDPEALYTKYYQCNNCNNIYEILIRDSWYRQGKKTEEISIWPYEGPLTAKELKAKAKEITGFITKADEDHILWSIDTKCAMETK